MRRWHSETQETDREALDGIQAQRQDSLGNLAITADWSKEVAATGLDNSA